MKFVMGLIVGILAGFAVYWFVSVREPGTEPGGQVRENAAQAGETVKDQFDAEAIKAEVTRTGKVIREKAKQAGAAISDATENARTTAAIKARLLKESALSGLAIDVDTNDGVVTLSGTVSSHDQIARAIKLALDTDGVRKVISTLQVKPG